MLNDMIKELAKTKPKYAYDVENFIPGKTQVQYSGPFFDETELEYALKALLTGKWITAGEYVNKFEARFCKMFGVDHGHMVNSGSSANLAMITALKKHLQWCDGSEIIVSPVGFPTTISPIVQNNLVPVFVDIEHDTLNFDVDLIQSKITENTRAIIVSPVLGNPPNMDALKELCDQNNIVLIGDNCDSLGSKWNGKWLTEYYYAWSCSFYPAHHITTGEGGIVCSNDEELINTVRSISWWGRDCRCVGAANTLPCGTCGNRFDKWLDGYDGIIDHRYLFTNIGYNLKPLDLQGAIGLAQLEKFHIIDRRRKQSRERISQMILELPGIRTADVLKGADPCWFGVPFICDSQAIKESLVAHFESNKIQTRSYFAGNILMHSAYRHLDNFKKYPKSNIALSHVFFLGCPPHYNDAIFDYIEGVINKWIG